MSFGELILFVLLSVISVIIQGLFYSVRGIRYLGASVVALCHRIHWLRHMVRATIAIFITVAAGGVWLGYYLYFNNKDMPHLIDFIHFEPPTIGYIYDEKGRPVIELAKEYRQVIGYEELAGLPIEGALLSAEDKDFFEHDGLSVKSVLRAAIKNYRSKATRQGGSTITQQIVRLYVPEIQKLKAGEDSDELLCHSYICGLAADFAGPRKINKYYRKLREAKMAIWTERVMRVRYYSKRKGKEEIMARWASYIYLSNGQYGVVAGAQYYFGKNLNELTPGEAAILAGITKSPAVYSPGSGNDNPVLWRRNLILDQMVENGYLASADADKYKKEKIPAPVGRPGMPVNVSASVDHTLRELKDRGYAHIINDIFEGRTEVHTTVNQEIQKIANEALEEGLAAYEKRHPKINGLIQGSVIVLRNHDAAILAETGGRKSYRGKSSRYTDFNRVTMAKRQPGSAFKPFIYLAAFESGMDLATIVQDKPIKVNMGAGRPAKIIRNYDKKYKGAIPLLQALSESRNAATIWVARQIQNQNNGKIKSVFIPAQQIGINSPIEPYITTSLGATDVTLLELANAYRTLSCGLSGQPYIIRRIKWPHGEIERTFIPEMHMPEISLNSMTLIQIGLRSVVRLPSGTAHALDASDFPVAVAGKTGTTTAFKDSIFVGFTYGPTGITVAVRIGFDNPSIGFDETGQFGKGPGRGLGDKETGSRAALPVFRTIVRKIYESGAVGPAPVFPDEIEAPITEYKEGLVNKAAK